MIIQGLNNVASAYGATYKSAVERQTSPAPEAKYADKVTLSSAAKTLAANETGATQTRTYAQERLLQAASSDTASAKKIAYGMANTPSTIFYDISGQPGVGDGPATVAFGTRKLSTTGEIVGDDYVEKFFSKSVAIDAQRKAIYETETKKGTDPVEILSKMIDFTNMQSQDYLNATGWGWRGSAPPA